MNCDICNTKLLPGAKFCHNCGAKVIIKMPCPVCKCLNPMHSKFCFQCGADLHNNAGQITKKAKDLFLDFLDTEVRLENGYPKPELIKSRFLSKKYKNLFDARFQQLDQDLSENALISEEKNISSSLLGLLEFFLIMYCKDLLPVELDERILKYDRAVYSFDLQQLAEDYLLLSQLEEDISYTLIDIDFDNLEQAASRFFDPNPKEQLVFMMDLSIAGNLKNGLAVTDKAIYWKLAFQSAVKLKYTDIEKLEIQSERLLINGKYLDVDASFNFRFRRFLQRMILLNLEAIKKRDA